MNRTRDEAWRDPSVIRLFEDMKESLTADHNRLANHPIYAMIQDPEALRVFMSSHIFAVWDFMTLLKSLQRALTSISLPWTPPEHVEAARFINELVTGEETDEIYPGVYISHFELYLLAMEECGANAEPVHGLVAAIQGGGDISELLDSLEGVPDGTRDFVRFTMAAALLPPHRVAASFVFGRENVIPEMFLQLLAHHTHKPRRTISPTRIRAREYSLKLAKFAERRYSPREVKLPSGPPRGEAFRIYLERHVGVNAESHRPMAERLLMAVCGRSGTRWEEAEETARESILVRDRMWHSVIRSIQSDRAAVFQANGQT